MFVVFFGINKTMHLLVEVKALKTNLPLKYDPILYHNIVQIAPLRATTTVAISELELLYFQNDLYVLNTQVTSMFS